MVVELSTSTTTTVNMLTVTHSDRTAFHTRSCTQENPPNATSTPHPDVSPQISQEVTPMPEPLTADRLQVLLQMQRTDPFCKCISKYLFNGKVPQHKMDTFTHVKELLYKYIMDSGKLFLALVIPKS